MRFGILFLASLFMIGCANSTNKCGDKVVLLWPDASGKYTFQEVQLTSINNLYELRGAAAEVYYEAAVTESGFDGQPARPRVTQAGGVCVPQDIDSALSITAYAVMERLWEFEKSLGTAAQVGWPRKVGVEIHMRGTPGETHNNAHYFGLQDLVTVVPYSRDGLPVGLNHGILAHEHFHAHFQSQVINQLNQAAPVIIASENILTPGLPGMKPADLENALSGSPRELNNFVVRGWNEGLADFFAGIFTGRPDAFIESMPGAMATRSLQLPLSRFATAADFMVAPHAWCPDVMGYRDRLMCIAYGQGALLARLLYRLAHTGSHTPQQFLSQVMGNLKDIAPMLTPNYATVQAEPDSVVPVLLKGVPLNVQACAYLAQTVHKDAFERGLTQCSP